MSLSLSLLFSSLVSFCSSSLSLASSLTFLLFFSLSLYLPLMLFLTPKEIGILPGYHCHMRDMMKFGHGAYCIFSPCDYVRAFYAQLILIQEFLCITHTHTHTHTCVMAGINSACIHSVFKFVTPRGNIDAQEHNRETVLTENRSVSSIGPPRVIFTSFDRSHASLVHSFTGQ